MADRHGFAKVVHRAPPYGLDRGSDAAVTGEHQDFKIWTQVQQLRQQLQAALAGQIQIQHAPLNGLFQQSRFCFLMPAGKPGIDPEKHHKLELAISGQSNGWHWRPAAWVDQVDGFVLRTRNTDGVSVYHNIDARLMGVEAQFGWSSGSWSTRSGLASVRGVNREENKPLPQIPPVQFIQTLAWQHKGHGLELEWMLARRQDRVDLESGQDPGASPGFGVLHVSGSHSLADTLSVSWAVDNLFDNTWAPHVSRANTDPFNPEAVRVNERGRTVRAALTASW